MAVTFDGNSPSYNKFTELPNLSSYCISYLMDNNESIWKLLKYSEPDAWNTSDLTKSEKGALIYDGSADQTKFRVFLDTGNDNSWTVQACMLRISPVEITPTNYVYGYVTMGFEVYSHYMINTLSNYTVRTMAITQALIETFNGAEIGGLGKLYFDARANPRCRSTVIGSIPYKGMGTIMCNWLTG